MMNDQTPARERYVDRMRLKASEQQLSWVSPWLERHTALRTLRQVLYIVATNNRTKIGNPMCRMEKVLDGDPNGKGVAMNFTPERLSFST